MLGAFKKKSFIQATLMLFIFLVIMFGFGSIIIELKYRKAVSLYESCDYEQAQLYFKDLGYYKESQIYREELDKQREPQITDDYVQDEDKDGLDYPEVETNDPIIYLVSNEVSPGMVRSVTAIENEGDIVAPSIENSGTIAIDKDGNEVTVENIKDKKVVLSYKEDGDEVFFFGKINDAGQWDGECLINVFSNSNLQNATKALFENGYKKEYEQIIIDKDNCVYSKRECIDNKNYGYTLKYGMVSNTHQILLYNDPQVEDFIVPSDFKDNITTNLESKYSGITVNGYYEDSTGEAYYISYYEDGTIKTLYNGKFSEGKFNDPDGDSWYITSEKTKEVKYMYYKGVFQDGAPKHGIAQNEEAINDVSYDKVLEVVKDKPFEKNLNWDMKYMSK